MTFRLWRCFCYILPWSIKGCFHLSAVVVHWVGDLKQFKTATDITIGRHSLGFHQMEGFVLFSRWSRNNNKCVLVWTTAINLIPLARYTMHCVDYFLGPAIWIDGFANLCIFQLVLSTSWVLVSTLRYTMYIYNVFTLTGVQVLKWTWWDYH